MDKGGFFLVYRGVFSDFGDAPYVERDAWLWLIASAGYENGNMGQINTTYSELAKAWNWVGGKNKLPDHKKVRRFLDKMAQQGRITRCPYNSVSSPANCPENARNVLCITICNYTKYQLKKSSLARELPGKCPEEKLVCPDPPIFGSLKEKKENKEINKEVPIETIGLSGPVHPKPNSQVQTDTPVTKTKAQIKREKAEAKKTEREHQLADIKASLFSFEFDYPNVDVNLEFEKMIYWLENTAKGKLRTDINKTWKNWLLREQTRLNTMKLFPRNSANGKNNTEPESFLNQVKREAQKLKQINERFTK